MAEPLPYTLLSLHRFAQILQINPAHFSGATGNNVFPILGSGEGCNDVWPRYSWQAGNRVSHEDIALTIQECEQEIARELGYWPAPTWASQEVHQYPRHHRPDVWRRYGMNVRGTGLSVQTDYAKVINGGRRDTDPVDTGVTVDYSDADGDGYSETATVEATTALTDASEIKVYFAGYSGDRQFEIRPVRTKTLSAAGAFAATFWSWQFLDPDLLGAFPGPGGFAAINLDLEDMTNYVGTADIYREYNDTTEDAVEFWWETAVSGSALDNIVCDTCDPTTQGGCIRIRDAELGLVVPRPGAYDVATSAWSVSGFTVDRNPDFLKLWYYSGLMAEDYLAGYRQAWRPLSNFWAVTIARMAIARLNRPFCSCGPVMANAQLWQQDLAAASQKELQAQSYQIDPAIVLQNPFGTRLGEVAAWQRVRKERLVKEGGIV